MQARSRSTLITLLAATALLAACAGDSTGPSQARTTQRAVSSFVPSAASKTIWGVEDGVYTIVVDPTQDQSFDLGPNHLDFPANSICDPVTSDYGPAYWNQSCTPATEPITITAVVQDARFSTSRIDFQPALRFNPDKNVMLFMYVPNATIADARNWVMGYCDALNVCVDESLSDTDLQSYVDPSVNVVFRRIKHFSGYVVAENSDGSDSGSTEIPQ